MLFHSQSFLLLFFPLTVVGYYLVSANRAARTWLLICASVVFYGYWDYRLVPLLLGSICANWALARTFGATPRRWLVYSGIFLNLIILGVFKYADFFAESIAMVTGERRDDWNIVLPLAISFFTFQQISYLVERGRDAAPEYRFRDYVLYVSFFPQLIAGPIVRHHEIIYQFAQSPLRPGVSERISRGMTLLIIGLIKKVFIADNLARIVDPIFAKSMSEASIGGVDAWVATLGFSLQIYFDFSAYSDMAIGLGLILGFTLPANFNAPYQASSIREFWRRWHMTLSRFLRDYLYIPWGGNRIGIARQFLALTATMLLGGLWHGAGWTFVAWGGIHGVGLVVNHLWTRVGLSMPSLLGRAMTIMFVFSAFVVFRAESIQSAVVILGDLAFTAEVGVLPTAKNAAMLGAALLIAILFPTSQRLAFELLRPHPAVAIMAAVALVLVLLKIGAGQNVEFIYFQF